MTPAAFLVHTDTGAHVDSSTPNRRLQVVSMLAAQDMMTPVGPFL